MATEHLDANTVERALHGEIAPGELMRSLLAHLLEVCPPCRRAWQVAAYPATDLPPGDEVRFYGRLFERAAARAGRREVSLEEELTQAPELLAELLAAPPEQQLLLLTDAPRYWTWGLCDLLINRSHQAAFEDPQVAEALARLALWLAERLDAERYGRRFLEDVRAMAWAYLGNAQRIASNLRQADASLTTAAAYLGRGTGDPLTAAQVASLTASLRRDQRRLGECHALLDQVIALYQEADDPHMVGRSLIKKAHCFHEEGKLDAAVPLLEQAVDLIDRDREPRTLLCAHHNLVDNLIDSGRIAEAQALLEEIRPLYAGFDDRSTRLRLRWLEGRLAAAAGRAADAEAALRHTRDGFVDAGIGYDAALVTLELAGLYAGRGDDDEVRRLAEEMLPIFRSRDVHREAMAALIIFQQAARAQAVTRQMVEEMVAYLHRARRNPALRYEPQA
jgi:tetratricopeptide (TPR) repeat protein